jgi:hypothetical protein
MFRTELPLTPHARHLPLSARVLTIGSCFSDSIGARLAADKVHTLVNPFGTVFNPLSACQLLRAAAGEDMDWQQHVVEARGRWQSYDLHASIGADSPVELLQDIQQLLRDTGVFLATADVVVLTLGSAWVYRLRETGELVNNCHKVPADKFDKELLTPDEIINAVAETHAYLRRRNPRLRFVLTVSPVRHLKDTLPLNAVSKSVLRVACHYLSELLPDVSYFPAYELLLDDLRDYRFYAEDMLHPSKVAEDYIWERFARTYFDADFGRFRKEWEAVQKALGHRPLHLGAPEHWQFLESTLERLERLASQADFRMEILDVRRQIESLPQPKLPPEPELDLEDDEERIDIGEYALVTRETIAVAAVKDAAPEPTIASDEEETVEDDVAATAETETAEILDALAPAKKKRRSRGGAKHNKKKQTARLAAEEASPETAGSAKVTVAAPGLVPAEQPTEQAPRGPRPPAPAAVITANADVPLQTAVERRKRNSRRGRGRKSPEPAVEQQASLDENPQLPQELAPVAPNVSGPKPAAEEIAETTPAAIESGGEPPSPPEPMTASKLARSGRSASEKRAAALRRPHRSASPIRTLYAPADSTLENAASKPTLTAKKPAAPALVRQPEAVSEAPPAIPETKGTGASGQLNARGTATRHSRPNRTRTEPAATPPAEAPPTAPLAAAPAAEAPATAAAPAAPEAVAPAAAPSAPRQQPRRAPARPAPTAASPAEVPAEAPVAPLPEAPTPASAQEPAPTEAPAPARAPRKSRTKPKAASSAEVSVETPVGAPASSPARRSRKATPAPPAEAPPAPAKKPRRPARRKPAAPDSPAEEA